MSFTISDILHNIGRMLTFSPDAPMIFSSATFWALFLIFIPVFAILRRRLIQMLLFVVAFSFFFYYKSSGWFVLLLAFTSVADWYLSHAIFKAPRKSVRRLCLAVSLCMSMGILFYFKYANFFLWNWNLMVEGNFQPLDIVLPVGISFYTFQSASYIIDVYKQKVKPTDTWLEYAFFLSFFPALVAGPIVRADYFLPQIRQNRRPPLGEMYAGLWLILLGVLKKALIADYISQYNDLIFMNAGDYSGFETLMGAVGYLMQIYCDFSGYSDMAIGIAMIMGFRLAQNFNFPYKSKNVSEFWRRWHISLSTWIRDYIYIPLGGNRKGTLRTYLNNFITMLAAGLWHGAGWKFIFWGGIHGVALIVHKLCRPWLNRIPDTRPVKIASWFVTTVFVMITFIYFRAENITDAALIIKQIFTDFSLAYLVPFVKVRYVWVIMMACIITAHALPSAWVDRAGVWFVRSPWLIKLCVFLVVVQLVIEFRSADVMPFIYFQF